MAPPNILVVMTEHHRGDWTEFNSDLPLKTPNLKKLGENGVYINQAVCPSPLCVPSRACFASGREYDNCDIVDNGQNYPLHQSTFYRLLRDEAGYHTMMCGKFDMAKPLHAFHENGNRDFSENNEEDKKENNRLLEGWHESAKEFIRGKNLMEEWGISDGIDNGGKFDGVNCFKRGKPGPYLTYLKGRGKAKKHVRDLRMRGYLRTHACPLTQDEYCDDWINRQALKLLGRAPSDKPWYLQINFNGAHSPWDVTKGMKEDIENRDPDYPDASQRIWPFENRSNKIRQNFSAQVENIDKLFGELIEYLEQTDQLENSIVVFTADHGEMLLDHNLRGKRHPFHPSTNVPMMIFGPNVQARGLQELPAETIDLVGTFLDYAGIDIPSSMDCKSMKSFLEGETDDLPRNVVRSGLYRWRMAFDGRYKLVCGFEKDTFKDRFLRNSLTGNQKTVVKDPLILYDLEKDAKETRNIAAKHPEIVSRLMKDLVIPPKDGKSLYAGEGDLSNKFRGEIIGTCKKCKIVAKLSMFKGKPICDQCGRK